uniref:Uncharacterized protein n=1 Tax=Mycena chlorophos TaxID=658473 RepID=A0ABQ0LAP6_MYCCL|nr:predicted protein [Mycena chlorophos]
MHQSLPQPKRAAKPPAPGHLRRRTGSAVVGGGSGAGARRNTKKTRSPASAKRKTTAGKTPAAAPSSSSSSVVAINEDDDAFDLDSLTALTPSVMHMERDTRPASPCSPRSLVKLYHPDGRKALSTRTVESFAKGFVNARLRSVLRAPQTSKDTSIPAGRYTYASAACVYVSRIPTGNVAGTGSLGSEHERGILDALRALRLGLLLRLGCRLCAVPLLLLQRPPARAQPERKHRRRMSSHKTTATATSLQRPDPATRSRTILKMLHLGLARYRLLAIRHISALRPAASACQASETSRLEAILSTPTTTAFPDIPRDISRSLGLGWAVGECLPQVPLNIANRWMRGVSYHPQRS